MITIPYYELDSLSLKTNMKTVKYYNNTTEKIKFLLARLAYMVLKECKRYIIVAFYLCTNNRLISRNIN